MAQLDPLMRSQIGPMNGREARESGLRRKGRLRRERTSVCALRLADERAAPLVAQRGGPATGMIDDLIRSYPAGRVDSQGFSFYRCSEPLSQVIRSSMSRMRAARSCKDTGF
jgi:hypothetical protein